MSTVSKHILNEIAGKLEKKKDNFSERIKRLESLSQKTLEIMVGIIDLYEKMESKMGLTLEEEKELKRLSDDLAERDDIKEQMP